MARALKPLLAVDGDSLAHRAYHALPKQIRRAGGRPANMIVGFTNMLVGLWEIVEPRATFVGFDTLTTPTYRHVAFPAYQSGREFPPDLAASATMGMHLGTFDLTDEPLDEPPARFLATAAREGLKDAFVLAVGETRRFAAAAESRVESPATDSGGCA